MTLTNPPLAARARAGAHNGWDASGGDRPVAPVRRRNLTRVAVGVVVLAVSILGVVSLTTTATATRTVLVAARTVPAGEAITIADLRAIRVPATLPVPTIPATDQARVVGRRALSPLAAGAPITEQQVGPSGANSGTALVGATLNPGQFPTRLAVGDRVLIVTAPGPGGTDPGAELPPVRGIVTDRDPSGAHADGPTLVSLRVRATDAPAVAAAGGTGNLDLVVITP